MKTNKRKYRISIRRELKLRKSHFLIGILFLIFLGCIEEFNPKLNTSENLLVIDAALIKGENIQRIIVSRSSPVDEAEFNPVSGCNVWVEDMLGNTFSFDEEEAGSYSAAIPQQYLTYNSTFRLNVSTPDNSVYQSEYETILESSPIDSIYYKVEYYQSSSEEFEEGLQFYTDLKAADDATKNYLWSLEETWEIHTEYNIYGSYKRGSYIFPLYNPISDSIDVCWSTRMINDIFTSSTQNLSINEKKKIPLNFVGSNSKKTQTRYSLMVKQYALGNAAYKYWNQNKIAAVESGGLYQSQPSQSKSNIQNIDDPDEVILGFFWATSFSEKRIFFDGPLAINVSDCDIYPCLYVDDCLLIPLLEGLGKETVYLVPVTMSPTTQDSVIEWGFPLDQLCIDCTSEGGTTERPDFW